MADTMNVNGGRAKRPPQGPEAAPSAKPRARKAAPRGAGSGASGGPSATTAPEPPRMTPDDRKLHASLVRFYGMVGVGITGAGMARGDVGLATVGVNITSQAEGTADAWIELSQQNPRVRRVLQGFVQGSAAANLGGAHLGMIVPLLAARGMVNGQVATMFLSDEAKQFLAANGTPQSATNGASAAA